MHSEGREKDAWVMDDIGGRPRFEDAHCLVLDFQANPTRLLGGVFDGHSGREVADVAAKRFPPIFQKAVESGEPPAAALEKAFFVVDKETRGLPSGAVAVAFYLDGRDISFANTGDAELLLVSKRSHRILTENHRLTNEKERNRVIEAGARIWGSYVMLDDDYGLQCTRSLGDHAFRSIGVIPDPFVGRARLGAEDMWLIAACDGLWDVMLPEEAAAISRKLTTAKAVVEALHREVVMERRTPDNLTVMVVRAAR